MKKSQAATLKKSGSKNLDFFSAGKSSDATLKDTFEGADEKAVCLIKVHIFWEGHKILRNSGINIGVHLLIIEKKNEKWPQCPVWCKNKLKFWC